MSVAIRSKKSGIPSKSREKTAAFHKEPPPFLLFIVMLPSKIIAIYGSYSHFRILTRKKPGHFTGYIRISAFWPVKNLATLRVIFAFPHFDP